MRLLQSSPLETAESTGHSSVSESRGARYRILVVFPPIMLYGMERGVIEIFTLLRPHAEIDFLVMQANRRYTTKLYAELLKQGIHLSFFSDHQDWPRIGKPRSLRNFWRILSSIAVANIDVWRRAASSDAVYLPIPPAGLYSFFAAVLLRIRGKKVIYHFHDLPDPKYRLLLRLATLCVSDFVHNAGISFEMAKKAIPFVSGRKNHVIPCRIAYRYSGQRQAYRNGLERRIVFVGQVAHHKGIDLLIGALAQMPSRSDVVLEIAGGCSPEFREALDGLKTGAGNIRIRELGYCGDIHDLLKGAYVYVHPSPPSRFHESFGRGAVEAMAVAVPVVCFRSGALAELVTHEDNGLVCETESVECLAWNLQRMLDDPDLRDRCGERALERYRTRYSDEQVLRSWKDLLELPPAR